MLTFVLTIVFIYCKVLCFFISLVFILPLYYFPSLEKCINKYIYCLIIHPESQCHVSLWAQCSSLSFRERGKPATLVSLWHKFELLRIWSSVWNVERVVLQHILNLLNFWSEAICKSFCKIIIRVVFRKWVTFCYCGEFIYYFIQVFCIIFL